jgi:hypothetical protein
MRLNNIFGAEMRYAQKRPVGRFCFQVDDQFKGHGISIILFSIALKWIV